MPKNVIYLFGAGATHAVINGLDDSKRLLPSDILEKIGKYSPRGIDKRIWSLLTKNGNDVEHLISVLESQYNHSASEKIRRYYQRALIELAQKVSDLAPITLYTILSSLHLDIPPKYSNERLLAYFTLNYEDILEKSIGKKHFPNYCVDYGINLTKSRHEKQMKLIKLHGSFSWRNTRPVEIRRMRSLINGGKALWIPPGVEKRRDNYPFNLLWGKATEMLLNCDVLRVVGCSLSRNDWGLIPILYMIKKFSKTKTIKIEIIDYADVGDSIKHNYDYLEVKKISELEEVISYYREEKGIKVIAEENMNDRDKFSPFEEWLNSKIAQISEEIDTIDKNENVKAKDRFKLSSATFVHEFYYKTG